MNKRRVVIVGSGLAALCAAVELVDKGFQPILLERNSHIGGRTASWEEDGMPVESGLHRYLGFYKHLPNLLEHVGVELDNIICWEDEVEIRHPKHPFTVLGLAPFFKPIKTASGLLGKNDFLSPSEKVILTKFFVAGAALYVTSPNKLDSFSLEVFAFPQGVPRETLEKLLIPLSEGIFFLPINTYSAYAFFGLFLPYVHRSPKTRAGAFMGGMGDVMMRPMVEYILARGGELHTDAEVTKIEIQNEKVKGVWFGDEILSIDYVILATSLGGAKSIIKNSTKHPFFDPMLQLSSMPAVTFQIELTEPALEVDRTTFGPTTALASFSEQSRTTFQNTAGRLSIILATPEKFIHMSPKDILKVVLDEMKLVGIDIDKKVLRYRKIVEADDFYQLSPGSNELRPEQETPVHGLYLAGDYTKQRYLATMEGAVFSGKLAAKKLLERYD